MKTQTITTAFLILGLLLISNSITGMYLLDWEKVGKDYCTKDDGCLEGLVCCKLYEENVGVCAKKSECSAIYQVTIETKSTQTSTNPQQIPLKKVMNIESPLNMPSNTTVLIIGIALVILGIITKNKKPKDGFDH
ncbi:MAG: hypothetical protein KJ674_02910 [Nanoarchaeota archaeon]|nr:hypothetical protein [Nanoarchaeota archaeon]